MNVKRFILASVAVFALYMVSDYIIHMWIMGVQYQAVEGLWRKNMEDFMWMMWIGELIFSFVFVYAFTKGYEGKGIVEGVRFGVIIGFLVQVFNSVGQYVVYTVPKMIAIQWIVYGLIVYVIFGIVTSLIYKPK